MRLLLTYCLILASFISFSGCMHKPAPNLPADWQGTPIPLASLADKDTDKLYVFIMYDKRMCAHTLLRIHSPRYGTVFWDPAGGYGKPEYPVVARRRDDLVIDPIPSIADYLSFRQYLPTSKVEIFEFDITPEQSKRLIGLLTPRAGQKHAPYKTDTKPMYCATTVSKFLSENAACSFTATLRCQSRPHCPLGLRFHYAIRGAVVEGFRLNGSRRKKLKDDCFPEFKSSVLNHGT